ncbi:hypothetical protein AU509_12025 [Lonsdalea britannica]|uniref:Uncharacterized protein n=1 Tax=Lonsdalea britannica TaxID=1082704 RepID=A0AAD0SIM4_9GAMM|nr:hypothetical protein CKQ53_13040 [Lonsdalea britannica]OSM95928.1 hypothetical protein AU509_12025 [Lonsdalea britannica]
MIRDEVIKTLSDNGEMTGAQIWSYCKHYGHSYPGVYGCIKQMTQEGVIIRSGEQGGYTYRMAPRVDTGSRRFDTRSHNPLVLLFDRRIREVRGIHEVCMAAH